LVPFSLTRFSLVRITVHAHPPTRQVTQSLYPALLGSGAAQKHIVDDHLSASPDGSRHRQHPGPLSLPKSSTHPFSEYTLGMHEIRTLKDGIVCKFSLVDEPGDDLEFERALFISFDYRTPPTPNAVGCEVDGTFLLLFNDLQKERCT